MQEKRGTKRPVEPFFLIPRLILNCFAHPSQVYLEVDRIDVHVGSATKMCEDSQARATRASVTIGELRETVSRFLSKVKNQLEQMPSVKDLPEKIHELDLQLTEMMKTVSANLAKVRMVGN